jgi:parallel beta-helix repeat protein
MFCIDYASQRMYVRNAVGAARMEYSYVPRAFEGGTSVSISNMAVDGYANTANEGAAIRAGTGWMVDGIEMSNNHSCAIAMIGSAGTVVRNSRFHDNGQFGFCGSSTGARFLGNEVDHNNRLGFKGSWGGGGGKFTESVNLTMTGNDVHDNNGNGIWFDVDSTGAVITGNTVTGNTRLFGAGNGIDYEISCHGTIDSNTVTGNAEAGILISNSHHVRVGSTGGGNRVSNNRGFGIRILSGGRGDVEPNCGSQRIVSAIAVVGNDITMPLGSSWNGVDRRSPSVARDIRFRANRYHMLRAAECLAPRWMWWNSSAVYRVSFWRRGITWQGTLRQDRAPLGRCGT